MRFCSYRFNTGEELVSSGYLVSSILVVGKYSDTRSLALHDCFSSTHGVVTFSYDQDSMEVFWGSVSVSIRNLDRLFSIDGGISKGLLEISTFDITTLNISEMIIILKLASLAGVASINFLYGESTSYKKHGANHSDTTTLDDRDFNLSAELPDFRPVPFATFSPARYPESKGVVFFGFEQERVAKLFYDNERISEHEFFGVFQVPPSKPGWENDSTSRHFDFLTDQRACFNSFYFTASTDPSATYSLIKRIVNSFEREARDKVFFVPTGSKPMSLALASAWLDNICNGIIFDYPTISDNRSNGLSRVHYYTLSLENTGGSFEK